VASLFPEESIETVIATKSMPRAEWVRARVFGWMTEFLYFGRVLQIPFMALSARHRIVFRRLIEAFMDADAATLPIVGRLSAEMREKAEATQRGHHQFSYSERLLGLWWSPEVYPLAWLGVEGSLEAFYDEARRILELVCVQTGCPTDP